jgi:hypothetical protein
MVLLPVVVLEGSRRSLVGACLGRLDGVGAAGKVALEVLPLHQFRYQLEVNLVTESRPVVGFRG